MPAAGGADRHHPHGADRAVDRLAPGERQVLRAYRQSAPAAAMDRLTDPGKLGLSLKGLTTRSERVADGVTRVHLTGGNLRQLGPEVTDPYVVTIRQDGTWYPSLVFTVTDWLLAHPQRERP